ncbi:hypothetical protein JCM10212_004069 [Sporobolomyces blumeae]
MLSHLLHSRYTSTSAPLVVVSDSLLQPGQLLLHRLARPLSPSTPPTSSAPPTTSATRTIWICVDRPPNAYARVPQVQATDWIDCTFSQEFDTQLASTSKSPAATAEIDLCADDAPLKLERALVHLIERTDHGQSPSEVAVQVVVDGINELGEAIGNERVWRIVKVALQRLDKCKAGSRMLVLHHDDFPSLSTSTPGSPHPVSLLASLLSPALSSSTLHLTLHPPAHLEALSLHYNLSLPTPTTLDEPVDLRLSEFLERARDRGIGDPWRRPGRAEEEDERIMLDGLLGDDPAGTYRSGGGRGGRGSAMPSGLRFDEAGRAVDSGGKAVVQFSSRGITFGSSTAFGTKYAGARSSAAGGPGGDRANGDKRVVSLGFEGVVRRAGTADLEQVELGLVLDPCKMGKKRLEDVVSSPSNPSPLATSTGASTRPTKPAPNPAATDPASLPFSLSLTPSQLAARSLVQNPYEGSDRPIFGQAGYSGPVDVPAESRIGGPGGGAGHGGGLRVEYTPDRGDDLDEEEPDEDLEI